MRFLNLITVIGYRKYSVAKIISYSFPSKMILKQHYVKLSSHSYNEEENNALRIW